MSKRVNNAKGIPSKNKMHNNRLRKLRVEKDRLLKMKESGELEAMINEKGKALFNSLNRKIKALTPKRFLRRHQSR